MKLNVKPLAYFLIIVIFIISSFDVFLNVRIAGFSLRVIFLFIILLGLLYLITQARTGFSHKVEFLSAKYFFIWMGFLFLFIPHTTILARNIGYMVWLILLTVFIVILPYFVKRLTTYLKVLKWYVRSFTLISAFGLLQFFLGMNGISLFITQYWSNGKAPRINGFSYEPSYFSTYMLICWTFCFFMIINKNQLNKYLGIKIAFVLSSIVLILSTSRMGVLFMLLIVLVYLIKSMKKVVVSFKIEKQAFATLMPFVVLTALACIYAVFNFQQVYFLFNGLGIFGTAAHSTDTRLREFYDTLKAFSNSPLIGYSLGGIPSAVAEVRGFSITTQFEAKNVEGMNVFAEVLAASGIIGFAFFMIFIVTFFYKTYQLAKHLYTIDRTISNIILGLLLSLFIELLILNMNQNILRPYLWVHIAMVNLSYFTGKEILRLHNLSAKR